MAKKKERIFRGDLEITKENQHLYTDVTEVTGYVDVRQGATFTAPVLAKTGYVDVQEGATFTAPVLAKVTGYVDVQEGATFTAPVLAEVTGYVDVQEGATFTAPVLAKTGYVYVRQGATFTAPVLAEVTGYVDVRQGATFTAPVLAELTGSVYVRQGATFTAPVLAKVTGYVYVRQGATFTAPVLAEVTGYVDVQEGATINIPQTKGLNYRSVDNTLFVIESERTSKGISIYRGYVISSITGGKSNKNPCYVAEKDGFTAHGETVKSAIGDLQFKTVAEKFKNEPIGPDTEITVMRYRLVTGACDSGCRDFMDRFGIPYHIEPDANGIERTVEDQPMKASDLFPILKKVNAWGVNKFESLYQES